jgi:predicted RNA-binding protein with PUA-like domain
VEFKIKPIKELPAAVTLKRIKESGLLQDWDLVRLPRLSVMTVNKQQWDLIIDWAEQLKIR